MKNLLDTDSHATKDLSYVMPQLKASLPPFLSDFEKQEIIDTIFFLLSL